MASTEILSSLLTKTELIAETTAVSFFILFDMYCHSSGWRAPRRSSCPAYAVWLDVLQRPVSYNGHQMGIYWWSKTIFGLVVLVLYISLARSCVVFYVISLKSYLSAKPFLALQSTCMRIANKVALLLNIQRTERACLISALTGRDGAYFFLPSLPFPSSSSSFLCLSQERTAAQAHLLFTSRLSVCSVFWLHSLEIQTGLPRLGRSCLYPALSSSLLSARADRDGSPRWPPLHRLAFHASHHSRCISEVVIGKTCRWNGKAVRPLAGNFPYPFSKRPGPRHCRPHICK